MSLGTVELASGATLGPHSVILPAASIGERATVGPSSLVIRGNAAPAETRWMGNPIAAWHPGPRGIAPMTKRTAAPAGRGAARDLYTPNRGYHGYSVTACDLDLDYRVPTNRLTARA